MRRNRGRLMPVFMVMIVCLAMAFVVQQEGFAEPTTSIKQLSKARKAFFDAIFKASKSHSDEDYEGYRSMLMVDHTSMFWPVGRANEVTFLYDSSDRSLLTHWVTGRKGPTREFQLVCNSGKPQSGFKGTMAKYLQDRNLRLPKKLPASAIRLLQTRQPFARYIESAAEGVFYCTVFDEIAVENVKWGAEAKIPFQPSSQVARDGFKITLAEFRLMSRRTP